MENIYSDCWQAAGNSSTFTWIWKEGGGGGALHTLRN